VISSYEMRAGLVKALLFDGPSQIYLFLSFLLIDRVGFLTWAGPQKLAASPFTGGTQKVAADLDGTAGVAHDVAAAASTLRRRAGRPAEPQVPWRPRSHRRSSGRRAAGRWRSGEHGGAREPPLRRAISRRRQT
jgi:hypothetical protein